jgi:thymidylate synthase (FAD)
VKVGLVQVGGELVCAKAARVCTEDSEVADIFADVNDEKDLGILQRVMAYGHESVSEHLFFTFLISGVSRALSHQLVRTRIASYSQRSQRYIAEDGFSWVTPPSVRLSEARLDAFQDAMLACREAYRALLAAGVPAEDARFVLPNACETQLVMTMNARSLTHFLEERLCSTAQWEIRQLAEELLAQAKTKAPTLFDHVGPKCFKAGYCKEPVSKWRSCRKRNHLSQTVILPLAAVQERQQASVDAAKVLDVAVSDVRFTCDTCGKAHHCSDRYHAENVNGKCSKEV